MPNLSAHYLLLHGYRNSHPLELFHQCKRLLDVQVQDSFQPDNRGTERVNCWNREEWSADRVHFRPRHSSDDPKCHLPSSQWNYWTQVQDGTKVRFINFFNLLFL